MRQIRRDHHIKTPLITLTTDFGLRDSYVSAMKAVLIRHCPAARLIDVTHLVPRHDILSGSFTLERAVDAFAAGTIHLAVVDPGVGTNRRLIVVECNRHLVVCPDNGLITWTWRLNPRSRAHEITWRPPRASATFHGRDILAPIAGKLAAGQALDGLARPIDDPILLDVAPVPPSQRQGRVIQIDTFGNATTNFSHEHLSRDRTIEVRIKGRKLGRIRRTYGDVAPGEAMALVGSAGLLEIAVRDGSAASQLKLRVGDAVSIKPGSGSR